MRESICIDFNGTIEDSKHPVEGKKMGPPMPGALDALQDLHDIYHIIIHTTMANTPSGRKAVADWLEYYDVDYGEIVPKPAAVYYIDDKAVNHKSWKITKQRIGL
jgi:5'(3')-deoxyribonucleotidase